MASISSQRQSTSLSEDTGKIAQAEPQFILSCWKRQIPECSQFQVGKPILRPSSTMGIWHDLSIFISLSTCTWEEIQLVYAPSAVNVSVLCAFSSLFFCLCTIQIQQVPYSFHESPFILLAKKISQQGPVNGTWKGKRRKEKKEINFRKETN